LVVEKTEVLNYAMRLNVERASSGMATTPRLRLAAEERT